MKEEIVRSVLEKKVIAIIRRFSSDVCLRLAEAYAKGGIGLVEVTFNQKAPETWKDTAAAIRTIRERFAGAVRVGGNLTNWEWIAAGEWGKITVSAADLVSAVKGCGSTIS